MKKMSGPAVKKIQKILESIAIKKIHEASKKADFFGRKVIKESDIQ